MSIQKYDPREIRSFRLRNRVIDLKNCFENEKGLAWFMLTDIIQPKDRILLRETFSKYDLNLTFLSKKVIKLWFKDKESLLDLKSLLLGNIVKIESKSDKNSLTTESLKYLLEQKDFNLQFILWNQQLYRKEKMKEYLTFLSNNNDIQLIFIQKGLQESFQNSILVQGLFTPKHHY
jgi:hypothetical protein